MSARFEIYNLHGIGGATPKKRIAWAELYIQALLSCLIKATPGWRISSEAS